MPCPILFFWIKYAYTKYVYNNDNNLHIHTVMQKKSTTRPNLVGWQGHSKHNTYTLYMAAEYCMYLT